MQLAKSHFQILFSLEYLCFLGFVIVSTMPGHSESHYAYILVRHIKISPVWGVYTEYYKMSEGRTYFWTIFLCHPVYLENSEWHSNWIIISSLVTFFCTTDSLLPFWELLPLNIFITFGHAVVSFETRRNKIVLTWFQNHMSLWNRAQTSICKGRQISVCSILQFLE